MTLKNFLSIDFKKTTKILYTRHKIAYPFSVHLLQTFPHFFYFSCNHLVHMLV